MLTSNLGCVSLCRSQTCHAPSHYSVLFALHWVEVSIVIVMKQRSFGLHSLAEELPSLIDSLLFEHLYDTLILPSKVSSYSQTQFWSPYLYGMDLYGFSGKPGNIQMFLNKPHWQEEQLWTNGESSKHTTDDNALYLPQDWDKDLSSSIIIKHFPCTLCVTRHHTGIFISRWHWLVKTHFVICHTNISQYAVHSAWIRLLENL